MKVLELFSGIGSQHKALSILGIQAEYTQCEIDKNAIKSYNAIHGETKNLGNICEVKEEDLVEGQFDLITYSFPCTDISQAGKQQGLVKGSGTHSSLLWEVEKFIRKVKPKYLLMENVKALTGKKFIKYFTQWLILLEDYGYDSFWQVLNAKDYGIPQNRERVFAVSIRKDLRQDYEFPKKQKLNTRLQDILEKNVDEKYFLSQKMINCFTKEDTKNYNRKEIFLKNINRNIASTITTKSGQRPTDNYIGTYQFSKSDKFMKGKNRFQIGKNISDTLQTTQKEAVVFQDTLKSQLCNKLILENKVKAYDIVKHSYSNDRLNKDNAVEKNFNNISITLTTRADTIGVVVPEEQQLRIRKLTPLECMRLMGFSDEDYQNVRNIGMSDSQIYKQCGNSIVVNVLVEIFRNLFINKLNKNSLF